jgi:RND family efflux transporter MFP subunit
MTLHPRRAPLLPILSIGVLLGCLAAGCHKPEAAAEGEPPKPPPAPVKAVRAEEKPLGQWTELVGTTLAVPDHAARVTAAVEGRVVSLLQDANGQAVAEGQHVRAGDVIARLDDQVVRANRAKLEAALKEFEQQKRKAAIAVETAQIDAKRMRDVRADPRTAASVSPSDVRKAELALESAQADQAGVVAKEQSAVADLKAVEAQLAFYTLRAPIAGRLGVVQVQRGQTLAPGGLVTEVIDLEEIDALCYVPPEIASRLQRGQTAVIFAGEESVLLGEVVFVAVQAQPETGNFAAKVRFRNRDSRSVLLEQTIGWLSGVALHVPDDDRALRANSVVQVYVLTEPVEERLSIPDEALLEDRSPPGVVVVEKIEVKKNSEGKEEKTGMARILDAELGVRDRNQHRVEIRSLFDPTTKKSVSLYEDAEKKHPVFFVIEGGYGLKDKDPVKLEEEKEEEKKE